MFQPERIYVANKKVFKNDFIREFVEMQSRTCGIASLNDNMEVVMHLQPCGRMPVHIL